MKYGDYEHGKFWSDYEGIWLILPNRKSILIQPNGGHTLGRIVNPVRDYEITPFEFNCPKLVTRLKDAEVKPGAIVDAMFEGKCRRGVVTQLAGSNYVDFCEGNDVLEDSNAVIQIRGHIKDV